MFPAHRTPYAFTMLEIMLAIMIGVMVMAVAVPSVTGLVKDREARKSFEAFDAFVAAAQGRSRERGEPVRLVWESDRIVAAGTGDEEAPSVLEFAKGEKYVVEFPAALEENPSPFWTLWPTGTCEPALIHYSGPGVKWSAAYDPLTVQPTLTIDG